MKICFTAFHLFILVTYNAVAQQTQGSLHKTSPTLFHPISSVKNYGDSITIDPKIIATNKNLRYFIADIKKASIKLSPKANTIPAVIKSFLTSYSKTGFALADAGSDWNCCCDRDNSLPDRQVICQGTDGHLFMISYLTGGIGVVSRLILVKYNGDRIIDFWMANTTKALKNKNSIIDYLTTSKNEHFTISI